VYPNSQTVTLTDSSGATSYSDNVSGSWLSANGSSSGSNYAIGSGITLSPNQASMNALTTGTYTGSVLLYDQNNNQTTIYVTLSVNGGSTSGISWSPNPATITAAVNGYTQQVTISLYSATAGTFSIATNVAGSGLSNSAVTTSTTSPAAASVIVYGNPTSLSANTYYGYLNVVLTPLSGSAVSQQIPITFVVGSGGTTTTSGLVTPTALTFAYQAASGSILPSQNVVVTGTGTFSAAAPIYTQGQASGWLSVTPTSGSAPGTVTVSIPSPTALAVGTYTATVNVTPYGGAVATPVSVTLLVTAGTVLEASPGSLYFTYNSGYGNGPLPLDLIASDGSGDTMPVSLTPSASAASWLSIFPTIQNAGGAVQVSLNNASSLANGVYTGSVTMTASGAVNSPVNVPVVLVVTGSSVTGSSLILGSLSTFYATQGGAAPPAQTLSVSASTTTYYTAQVTQGNNWLSVTPSGQYTNSNLTVSVNPSGLTANTYPGTISLTANGISQTVSVTLVVSSTSTGTGNVTVSPASLSFGTYQVGGVVPGAQYLSVTSASGSASVSFTISTSSGATWLSTGVQNGASVNTPYNNPGFTISVNPSGLAPLSTPYSANITIQANGGNQVIVPVTLTVQAAATVTATSTPLAFTYQVGAASPPAQTVSVSGGGQSLGFTATVTSGSTWLSVSPTSGTTPTTGSAALTVTATPGTLGASSTPYAGTIVVSGTGTAGGSTTINVTLTVSAPLPTISALANAASGAQGAVSPGEIVTIYGTNLGPATAASAAIDSTTGKLATTIGGVQVLFNGIPAPVIYASNTQVNTIVPYEMASISSPSVWIKYANQTSNAYQLTSATTAPGLFTQNSSGSGPGDILNQNYTVNGPNNPAAKGSYVSVYMTGEGQTSPAGVTGSITTLSATGPLTPAPLLPVSVLINGQPANWNFAGEAPGFVAGLMQLNVQIPATAQSGVPNSIQVYVGTNPSQSGVTVSVQ
jgi:uncharacterized protein (TIGR03437 family)